MNSSVRTCAGLFITRHFKGPVLYPCLGCLVFFISQTPVKQPHMITYPKILQISRKHSKQPFVCSLPQKCSMNFLLKPLLC